MWSAVKRDRVITIHAGQIGHDVEVSDVLASSRSQGDRGPDKSSRAWPRAIEPDKVLEAHVTKSCQRVIGQDTVVEACVTKVEMIASLHHFK